MADLDAMLMRKVLHITQREREANMHHARQAYDLAAGPKKFERVCFRHGVTVRDHPAPLKRIPSDNALSSASDRRGTANPPT